MLICVLLALSVRPGMAAKDESDEAEVRRMEIDIPSLYLVNAMNFTPAQMRQYAALLTESVKIHEQNQQALRKFIQCHQRDMDALVDRMLADNADPESASRSRDRQDTSLSRVHADWQELTTRNRRSLDELANKCLTLLTPAQLDIIGRFSLYTFIPAEDLNSAARTAAQPGNTSLGEATLERLRKTPSADLNAAIDRALAALAPDIMRQRGASFSQAQMDELRDELRVPLKELTARARGMDDGEFARQKASMARQLLLAPASEAAGSVGTGPGAYNQDKIKTFLLNPGILPIIARRSGDPGAAFKPEITPAGILNDMRQKNNLLQTAGLMRSIQLTPAQARALLPVFQKASEACAAADAEAAALWPQAAKAYAVLKEALENRQSTKEAEAEAAKCQRQLRAIYYDKLTRSLLACEAEMDRLLSADQVATLMGRSPAAYRGSPVRQRARMLFNSMDSMNDREFAASGRSICREYIHSCRYAGVFDPQDIDAESEAERIEQLLARARKMRRNEYAKQREELIAEACPRRNRSRPLSPNWQGKPDPLASLNYSSRLLLSQAGLALAQKLAAK